MAAVNERNKAKVAAHVASRKKCSEKTQGYAKSLGAAAANIHVRGEVASNAYPTP